MTHTMSALVLNGPGDVQLAEKPIPEPEPGEVVLAVEATTICGTDLRIISGEKTTGYTPASPSATRSPDGSPPSAKEWKD